MGGLCLSVCNHCARRQVGAYLLWMLWEPLGAGLAAENEIWCAIGHSYLIDDIFYIQLCAKINSKRCCIGQDWNLCHVHLGCCLPGDFPLL